MTFVSDNLINNKTENAANHEWQLWRRRDGRLVLRQPNEDSGGMQEEPVQLACCFPWSHPSKYVSLRDDKGAELLLLESLDDLDAKVRALIEEELAYRDFLPRVTRIDAITDNTELFHWEVETTAGHRSFLTLRHERPRQLDNGDVLIRDIYNDLYIVARAEEMDAKSMKLLWVYLD